MTTNKAGKFQSVLNTRALWIDDHALRGGDIVNDEPTVAGATVKAALAAISALISASASAVQTLSNKSLVDSSTFFVNAADNTKKINFNLAGFPTATAKVWTIPPFSGTVMLGGNYNSTNLSCGDSSSAGGSNAVAFGPFAGARAESVALGANAITRTTDETAVGSAANTYSQGTACGRAAVGATLGLAMGYYSATNNTGAVALGANATASWNNSIALGRGAKTTVDNELAIRVGNSATTELRTPLTTDATARATLVTHLPVTINGVTYYIKLYQT